mgnify:CR=1 FL=1
MFAKIRHIFFSDEQILKKFQLYNFEKKHILILWPRFGAT